MEILSVEESNNGGEIRHSILIDTGSVISDMMRYQLSDGNPVWEMSGIQVDYVTSMELEQLFQEYNDTVVPEVIVEFLNGLEF